MPQRSRAPAAAGASPRKTCSTRSKAGRNHRPSLPLLHHASGPAAKNRSPGRLAIRSATKVTGKLLERAAKLKVVGRAGIGVDNVDIPAATAKGVIVMNTPFGNSITTAEHAIAMMLALARQIPQADASTQAGKWEKNRFMGVEITDKTLGVIGCGNIGSIVADRAQGLRMRVIAFDPFLSPERARRSRRREGRARRAVPARRFHHPAHAAHRQDQEHHRRRGDRDHEEGRAHHQLRARRPGRRGGAARGARFRPGRGRGVRRVRRGAGDRRTRCSAIPTWSARRISAPRPSEAQENVALQVAEQMSDYLLNGAISNAVNFPSISAEEAPRLKPFVGARREARLVRRPAHRDRALQGADRL